MAAQGIVGHQDLFTTINRIQKCGDSGSFTGEIAAGNAGSGAAATLVQFENSPEHNSIILGPGNAIGCGFARGTFQGFSPFDFYVCDFAQETSPGNPPPNPSPVPNPMPTPPPPTSCTPPLCGSTSGPGSQPPPPQPGACNPPLCGSTSGGSGGNGGLVGSGSFQCIPPTCASTSGGTSSSGGLPASTQPGVSSSGGAPASTTGSGTSTSGGAAAGTGGTICNPPLCASTGGH